MVLDIPSTSSSATPDGHNDSSPDSDAGTYSTTKIYEQPVPQWNREKPMPRPKLPFLSGFDDAFTERSLKIRMQSASALLKRPLTQDETNAFLESCVSFTS